MEPITPGRSIHQRQALHAPRWNGQIKVTPSFEFAAKDRALREKNRQLQTNKSKVKPCRCAGLLDAVVAWQTCVQHGCIFFQPFHWLPDN